MTEPGPTLLDQARAVWPVAQAAGRDVDEAGRAVTRTHFDAMSRAAQLVPALHDQVLHLSDLHAAVADAAARDVPLPPSVLAALNRIEQ